MTHRVAVTVATVWTSPDAPRALDAPALADRPDLAGWVAALDAEGTPDRRLDLDGRTLTQLLEGEPVEVLEEAGAWARVVAPWQSSSAHAAGYPGWVRRAHLAPAPGEVPPPTERSWAVDDVLGTARGLLGLRYLWGGTSSWGVDCSGLVHLAFRAQGRLVPRDAKDQAVAADLEPVPLDDVRPGDLYFFAKPDGRVYHVGFVTAPVADDGARRMLHAPEGRLVEDEPMAAERVERLVSAGRFSPR